MARNMTPTSLGDLSPRDRAEVATINWQALTDGETRRLREFGLDEGVEVEILHRSMLGGGPLACRIGRMTIAIRRHVANAIHVGPRAA